MMKLNDFMSQLEKACKVKSLYVMGCFGAPMNAKNKARYSDNLAYNRKPGRLKKIEAATSDTFGFDCVCLIKGILWGWNADVNSVYGGAGYKSNDVPDVGTEKLISLCYDVSTDFSDVKVGELLWMKGHVGIYAGNNNVIECSPAWEDGVQHTVLGNVPGTSGHTRIWTKHGKLPYVDYSVEAEPVAPKPSSSGRPLLVKGITGPDVVYLQNKLNSLNYNCGAADGIFGTKTYNAVVEFQRDNHLDVDGRVGPLTWAALETASPKPAPSPSPQPQPVDDETRIWNYLIDVINNEYGVAGLMGNIWAESAFSSINLQNTYNTKFGMTDQQFTEAVDSGKFDFGQLGSFGYGLCQWTYYTRRRALKSYADSKKVSIGNLNMQLEFMINELNGYGLLAPLKTAKSVREASDVILTKYEKPAGYEQETTKVKRASLGQQVYDKYTGTHVAEQDISVSQPTTYTVVKGDSLSKIAKSHGTTWTELAKINGIKFPYIIKIGQIIKLK